MEGIQERAREIGRLLAQTEEYKALRNANDRLAGDQETVALLNRLADLQEELTRSLRGGIEPSQEQQQEYEGLVEQLEGRSIYQGVVAAQSNFDRLMMRVNEEIGRGIEAGEQSRIILPS
ncbi:MAG: YlbF family regulator [Longimicrobiaceae bacterium]